MRRVRKKKDLHLDIAPINLIDLLLVILVFFITTTSFLQLKVIDLSLPDASSAEEILAKEHIHVINIDTTCAYFVDAKKVASLTDLDQTLTNIVKNDTKAIFQIGADRKSEHYCFVNVLDTLSKLNITNISILTNTH